MRLSSRSYPHPVVGNLDDVSDAEFQATFDFSSDKSNFYVTAITLCSSKTLNRLIKKGAACFSVHLECSNTIYRKLFDFQESPFRITIPTTDIHDTVEVNAFVRAVERIKDYVVEGAHSDYEGLVSQIMPGDILAVADTQAFEADHTVDPLRKIGSLMVVEQSSEAGDHPMDVDFNGEKIRILLCESDFAAYRELKSVPHLTSHLTTTLVLPVLIQAIQNLKDPEEVLETKWAKQLQARLENMEAGANADPLRVAQQLLEMPIRRALISSQALLAGSVTGG